MDQRIAHFLDLRQRGSGRGLLPRPALSRLCEKPLEPETYRIVFSIVVTGQKLAMQLVSASTKLGQMFYVQIEQPTFHTA
jgi:hypothetical protein